MEAWECIDKATEYIEQNLERKLTIEELAYEVNLSPFYFQRLFKRLVDKTVMEYIKLRRLARIAEEFRINSPDTITDICLRYGFENQETFSRNFKEAYGMTPTEYRKNPVILSHVIKPNIYLKYHIIDEDVPIVTDGIVLEVTRLSLQKPKYFAGYIAKGELTSPGVDPLEEVWKKLHRTKENISGYMFDGNEIGVNLNLAESMTERIYFAGVETSAEVMEQSLKTYTLTDRNYVVCKFDAEDFYTLTTDTIYKVYNYMYLWIQQKQLEVEPVAIELYYGSQPECSYMELWIPLAENVEVQNKVQDK